MIPQTLVFRPFFAKGLFRPPPWRDSSESRAIQACFNIKVCRAAFTPGSRISFPEPDGSVETETEQQTKKHLQRYTKDEDALLLKLREEGAVWGEIQRQLPYRSRKSLKLRWLYYIRPGVAPPKQRRRLFTLDEDNLIVELRSKRTGWTEIQRHLPRRSRNALRSRWDDHLRPDVPPPRTAGLYTQDEDALLLELRSQGAGWAEIKQQIPHRPLQSLRSRWDNYLRPEIDFDAERLRRYTKPAEAQKLSQMREDGWSWNDIRKAFPDRSFTTLFQATRNNRHITEENLKTHRQPWTTEDIERLFHLRDEKSLSWNEIAGHMPDHRIERLQAKYLRTKDGPRKAVPPRYTPEDDEKILRLKETGLTFAEIAKEFPRRSPKSVMSHYYRSANIFKSRNSATSQQEDVDQGRQAPI